MSIVTRVKCDFCFKIFFAEEADTEIETITIPGVKIGKDTYRLNNGHICKKTCLPLLERALGDTKEIVKETNIILTDDDWKAIAKDQF